MRGLIVCVALGALAVPAARAAAPTTAPTAEQRAVQDSIRRFVAFFKVKEITFAADSLYGTRPPKIEGCTITVEDRDAVIRRHEGEAVAPVIGSVNVTAASENHLPDGEGIVVLVMIGTAAFSGFDDTPEAIGREFVYRKTGDTFEFVQEVGWVE